METFSALLAVCAGISPGTGEFPTKRPVTRSFDVYFDLRPYKRMSKQLWGTQFSKLLGTNNENVLGFPVTAVTVFRWKFRILTPPE